MSDADVVFDREQLTSEEQELWDMAISGDDTATKRMTKKLLVTIWLLRGAIRTHRDEKGHDRCWKDHEKLYAILPEPGPEGAGTLPPHDEFLTNCERYWQSEKAGEAWCSERQRAEKAEARCAAYEADRIPFAEAFAKPITERADKAEAELKQCYTKVEGDRLVDMYNRERERADKFEKLDNDEEREHGHTIDQRDAMEQRVNAIGMQLNLSEQEMEWSNLNDVGAQCIEAAAILEARALKAEAALLKWESGEAEREMMVRYSKSEAKIAVLTKVLMSPELLEEMAAIEHSRWGGWETYRESVLAKGDRRKPEDPETHLERWKRLRETPYRDLTEAEKESDRVEARKTRDLVKMALGLGP